MNETADYLDHFSRSRADVIEATIESRNDDGTYMVRTIARQAILRASKSNPADEFTVGERVLVQLPSASGNSIGAGAVIVSRAPRDQRGLSGTTPAEEVGSFDAAIVISVDPDPLILVADGEEGQQIITGSGLTAAAAYVASGTGSAPTIFETEGADIADTEVTMTVRADVASATGTFDLTINGVRVRNALKVLPPGPVSVEFGVFVLAGGGTNQTLVTVRDYTGETLATSADLGAAILRFVQVSADEFAVFLVGGGGWLATVDPVTGAIALASRPFPLPCLDRTQFAVDGVSIFYGDSLNRLLEVSLVTGGILNVWKSADTTPWRAVHVDVGSNCIFTGNATADSGFYRVRRIHRGTLVETVTTNAASIPTGAGAPRVIAGDGTKVYVIGGTEASGSSSLFRWRYNIATLALEAGSENLGLSTYSRTNGDAFVTHGRMLLTRRRDSSTISRFAEWVTLTPSTSGQWADAGTGLGVTVIPAAEGELLFDAAWFVTALAAPPNTVQLHAHQLGGTSAQFSAYASTINTALTGVAADCGLGWVAVA